MFNKNLITSAILAGIIAISGTAAAFAEKNSGNMQNIPNISMPVRINPEQMHTRIKSALDGLVKEGRITQTQEDAVLNEMAARKNKFAGKGKELCKDGKCEHHNRKHSFLEDLVKAGTITQDQAEAIKNAIKSAHDSMNK